MQQDHKRRPTLDSHLPLLPSTLSIEKITSVQEPENPENKVEDVKKPEPKCCNICGSCTIS